MCVLVYNLFLVFPSYQVYIHTCTPVTEYRTARERYEREKEDRAERTCVRFRQITRLLPRLLNYSGLYVKAIRASCYTNGMLATLASFLPTFLILKKQFAISVSQDLSRPSAGRLHNLSSSSSNNNNNNCQLIFMYSIIPHKCASLLWLYLLLP